MAHPPASVVVLCGVQIVDVMGVTVVVSALPRMLADLGASPATAGLLVPGYAVGFAALLLVAARWGDRHGHRRVLLGGLVLFAAASVLAAVAPTMAVLVGARFLQGVAAAVSVPNALVLLTRDAGPEPGRGRALSAWNACGGLAGAAGLLVGGIATSAVGWRAIFWANIAVTVVLAVGVLRAVGADRPGDRRRDRIDPGSAVLQVATIALVVAAADAARHSGALLGALGGLAVGAAALLVVRERRSSAPLVAPELWRRPAFVAGLAGSFGVTATTSVLVVITTVHLQQDLGFSAATAGLMILAFSAGVVAGAAAAGRLLAAGAATVLVAGLAAIGAGAAAAAAVPGSTVVVVVALVLAGLGNGVGAVAAYALGTDVSAAQQASAAGLLNTAAQIGTAVVVAVGVAVAAAAGGGTALEPRTGALVSVVAAVVIIAGVLACARSARRPRVTA
jgi:MFS family permease